MKYLKKKKRNKLVVAIVVAGALLAVLLALLVWLECDAGGQEELPAMSENTAQTDQSTEVTDPEYDPAATQHQTTEGTPTAGEDELFLTGEIETPYLTLYFDTALTDHLAIVHDPGTPYGLEFYATLDEKPEQRIFDILIGAGADGNLGVIETTLGKVPVSMIMYAFAPDESWTQDEVNTVLALQEVSNDLMEQILALQTAQDYEGPNLSTEVPESNISDDIEIITPYGILLYPAKWGTNLQVEQSEADDYRVMFYCNLDRNESVLLFTLIYGGDYGEQLGVIQDSQGRYLPVNLLMEEISENDYAGDLSILYEMQEAVNLLIDKLPLE